jgi:hypothetical protein
MDFLCKQRKENSTTVGCLFSLNFVQHIDPLHTQHNYNQMLLRSYTDC